MVIKQIFIDSSTEKNSVSVLSNKTDAMALPESGHVTDILHVHITFVMEVMIHFSALILDVCRHFEPSDIKSRH